MTAERWTPTGAVRVMGARTNNAQLMVDAYRLGYLGPDGGRVLDMTYGLGAFWKLLRSFGNLPFTLLANDLHIRDLDMRCDFTKLDQWEDWKGLFDAIVFDPPYKLNGTPSHESDERYGVGGEFTSAKDRMQAIHDGIYVASRLLPDGGFLLVKCQDQVNAGRKVWQTDDVTRWASVQGLGKVDQMHVNGYRPQPPGRTQRTARQDYSTLLVFRR